VALEAAPWADVLHVESPGMEFSLFLLKDGPPADLAAADLAAAAAAS